MEDDKLNKGYFINFRRWFFLIWVLFMIIVGSILIVTYGSHWRFYYNARMTKFSVCSGLDSNGNPVPITRPITVEAKEINICGYLEGNGPIPLIFDLYYNGEAIINPLTGHYPVGYITARITAPSRGFRSGNYLVVVYQGRNELASTQFTVEGP